MNTSPTALVSRRRFVGDLTVAGSGLLLAGSSGSPLLAASKQAYKGPNVILIRFGGGARRRESIDPRHTHTPFTCHELVRRGVLYSRMEIDQLLDLNTSHGEGTLNLITGCYEKYRDIGETRADASRKLLGARFEAQVPTLFEYLRASFDVPDHQALIVNGEDRGDEEFYNFSNHHLFGVSYRSQTLSLRRYKGWLLREQLAEHKWDGKALLEKQAELRKLEDIDYRATKETGQGAEIATFWANWRRYYGESGLVNPRGDRLLTELALRAIKELQPRLMMINYHDCDYVHWGYFSHYTRALSIMDDGIKQIVAAVGNNPEYRDNTVFAIVPDCGRDDNPFMNVPCQHHFNSRAAHEIFALFFGRGIARGQVVDRRTQQISVARTLAQCMGFSAEHAKGPVLPEVFS